MKTRWTALTKPNRVHIAELLRDGPLTGGEIALFEQRKEAAVALEDPRVSSGTGVAHLAYRIKKEAS